MRMRVADAIPEIVQVAFVALGCDGLAVAEELVEP